MDKMYVIRMIVLMIVVANGFYFSPKIIEGMGLFDDKLDDNDVN